MFLGMVNLKWLEGDQRFLVTASHAEGKETTLLCYDSEGHLVYEFHSDALVKSTNYNSRSTSHLFVSTVSEIVLVDYRGLKQKSLSLQPSTERFQHSKVECLAWNSSGDLIAMLTNLSIRVWLLQNNELCLIQEIPIPLRQVRASSRSNPKLIWHQEDPLRMTFVCEGNIPRTAGPAALKSFIEEIRTYDFQDCEVESRFESADAYVRCLNGCKFLIS